MMEVDVASESEMLETFHSVEPQVLPPIEMTMDQIKKRDKFNHINANSRDYPSIKQKFLPYISERDGRGRIIEGEGPSLVKKKELIPNWFQFKRRMKAAEKRERKRIEGLGKVQSKPTDLNLYSVILNHSKMPYLFDDLLEQSDEATAPLEGVSSLRDSFMKNKSTPSLPLVRKSYVDAAVFNSDGKRSKNTVLKKIIQRHEEVKKKENESLSILPKGCHL